MNRDTVFSLKWPFLGLKESKERMKPAGREASMINKLVWTANTHLEVVEPGRSESRCLTVERSGVCCLHVRPLIPPVRLYPHTH